MVAAGESVGVSLWIGGRMCLGWGWGGLGEVEYGVRGVGQGKGVGGVV